MKVQNLITGVLPYHPQRQINLPQEVATSSLSFVALLKDFYPFLKIYDLSRNQWQREGPERSSVVSCYVDLLKHSVHPLPVSSQ